LIVSGTAGESREGILWDTLVKGRNPEDPTGIVEYAAPEDTAVEEHGDDDLLRRVHPGIDTLTTVEIVADNRKDMPGPKFAREYLGLWPETYASAVIPAEVWEGAIVPAVTSYPKDVAFGFDISPNGSTAAIVAAWRVNEVAYIEEVQFQSGSAWVQRRVVELVRKYSASLGFDDIGANRGVFENLQRGRLVPKARLQPQTYKDIPQACVALLRDLEDGNLHHFGSAGLTDAALTVARRKMGENAWAWGRSASGGDITPIVAATMALRAYDVAIKRPRLGVIIA
jgi:hypothetical protein